ncbi:MAG: hypothetical protein ACO1N5_18245 [Noviherbaspirillum sp.]
MKTLLKGISIAVLLLTAWSAQADPGEERGLREGLRQEWQQPRADREYQADAGRLQDYQESQGQAQEARPQGRMSLEQRRALRRQIGEAGQDIYRRNRR